MSSGWTSAARSPTPSSTTTRAPCSRRSRPSTPPDYSRGVLDVLELLAEQLGRSLAEMLADTHHIAHGTTSSLNALVTGNVPAGRVPHHQGPPRLDLHHERRGPLSRPLRRTSCRHVLGQRKPHGCSPSGTRWRSPSGSTATGTSSSRSTRTTPATRSARCSTTASRAIAVSLLWSFRNPAHERRMRELVAEADPDVFVALSSEVSPRIREFARNATTIMSTQIGPGLRDYLVHAGGQAARARAGRPAAGHAVQRRRRRRARRRRPPRSARSGRCSPAGSSARSRWAASSATATSSPPTSAAPRSWPGSSSTASRCAPPPRSSTTTRSTSRRCRSRRSAPAAAPSPGSTRAATCGSARAARRPCPGPACYGQRRHRTDQHRRQPGARHPPRARACSAGASRCRLELARQAIDTQIAEAAGLVRRGGRGRDLRRAERADRRPAAQDRRRGRPRSRASSCVYAFGGAGPRALRPLRRRGRRHARSWCRSGRWPRRSPRTGWRPRTSCWPPSCPTRRACRSTRPGRSATSPTLEQQVRDGLDRQGLRFATVELAPRDRHALHDAARRGHRAGGGRPARRGRDRGRRGGVRAALRRAVRQGRRVPRGRHPGHHLPGPRRSACCRSAPQLPEVPAADAADPRGRAGRHPAGVPRRRAPASSTPRSTTTASCARATSSPGPRSSRCRPPPSSCPAGTTGTRRPTSATCTIRDR